MQLDLVQESWQELKRYINTMDRPDAAEGLVSVLIENGIDAEDIRETFPSDGDIKAALSGYVDDDVSDDDEDNYQELDFGDD